MRRSVKTITLASIFGSLTILAVLAVASWDRILEGWYLQQLSSSDKEAQLRAAERLVELEWVPSRTRSRSRSRRAADGAGTARWGEVGVTPSGSARLSSKPRQRMDSARASTSSLASA